MYIVLEGIDTSGKSTQLDILKQKYPDAIFTKEPGGTELGTVIREMVLNAKAKSKAAEMMLFLADRAEHAKQVIKPNRDKVIISDRSFISGIAYAKDFDIDLVTMLNKIVIDGEYPDKLVMMELGEEELRKRLAAKEHDKIESRGTDYLLDIQSRMKNIIDSLNIETLIVDAGSSIDEIANKIEEFLEK